MDGPQELLTIKEAAALLRVSETSLRRWTSDGTLRCFRVGGRRERRFRRHDLMAVLEGGDPTAAREPQRPPAAPVHHGSGPRAHPVSPVHGCAFYSSGDERVDQAVEFVDEALRLGNVSFVVAAPEVREAILDRLAVHRRSLQAEIDAARLVLSAYQASAAAQIDYWERAFTHSVRAGAKALRVVGDVTSARFTSQPTIEDAIAYEEAYEQRLVHRFPLTTLCQYDVRGLAGQEVLRVQAAHRH